MENKTNNVLNLKNDWRFQGQDKYLLNVSLIYCAYKPSDGNDHDHCEFCWETFSQLEGYLHEGYCTMDQYRWICEKCFDDFNEMFKWKIIV